MLGRERITGFTCSSMAADTISTPSKNKIPLRLFSEHIEGIESDASSTAWRWTPVPGGQSS
jgi:hypothetical protein